MAVLVVMNFLYLTVMNKRKAAAIREGKDNLHFGNGDKRLDFTYIR